MGKSGYRTYHEIRMSNTSIPENVEPGFIPKEEKVPDLLTETPQNFMGCSRGIMEND